jgi:hypothetical protein
MQDHQNGEEFRWAAGLALGIAIGAAIGIALDNIAVGIGVGVGIGLALYYRSTRRDNDDSSTA